MSSPWCRAWEIGSGDIFSGYGNKTLDKKIELKFSGNCWDISWCLYFLTLNRFCKPGEWVLILHADLFKFHPEPVWQSIKYKLQPAIYYSYFIMLMLFLFLPAPKRLMNGLYILGYTVTAILFQTMINFGLFHFLIFIPQGTYYPIPMCIISA